MLRKQRAIVVGMILGLIVLGNLTYWKIRYNRYAFDDVPIVYANPLIKDPQASYLKLWTSTDRQQAIALSTLRWSHQNLDNPALFDHLVNVNLHVLVTIAFFILLLRLTVRKRVAVILAAAYLVYPVHTEAVASLLGRSDLLAALFLLVSMLLVVSRRKLDLVTYSTCFVTFVAAMLCKETALVGLVSLPALYVFHYWRQQQQLPSKNNLIVLTSVASVAVLITLLIPFSPTRMAFVHPTTAAIWSGLANASFFIKKIFVPIPLLPIYHVGLFSSSQEYNLAAWFTLGVVVVAIAGFLYAWKEKKLLSFSVLGGALFLAAVLPMSNLVFQHPSIFMERYLYVPLLFFTMIAAEPFLWRYFGPAMPGLLAVVILMNGAISYYRIPAWIDNIALMSRAVADDPRNIFCQATLGRHYLHAYYFRDAIRHLSIVDQTNPTDVANKLLLAEAYIGEDRFVDAAAVLKSTEVLAGKNQTDAIYYLQYVVNRNAGDYLAARGRLQLLIDRLQEAPQPLRELELTLQKSNDRFGLAIVKSARSKH